EIVETETRLGAVSDDIERTALQARVAKLRGDYDDRILRLRIVDPAMGSGHFLLSACQYLAAEIATHPLSADPDADRLGDESALTFWKRRIVEHCLYGVDENPLAVELAKLQLCLETCSAAQ